MKKTERQLRLTIQLNPLQLKIEGEFFETRD